MRRMNELAGRGKPSTLSPGLVVSANSDSILEVPAVNVTPSSKGKEKEIPSSSAQADDFGTSSHAIPYLSSPGLLGAHVPTDWSRVPQSVEEADAALGDRLRVLREVDQTVWALVSELTRMRQGWSGGPPIEDVGQAGDDTPPAVSSAPRSIHDEL